jgi:hypothetical protein
MEKEQPPSRGRTVELDLLKVDPSPTTHDVDFGQVLGTSATPEMERKVLWKLDLL